jgi:heptosyltransferase-1
MPATFKNILIIKPSSLGDIVLALPALTALRKGLPDAQISWLVRPEFAPLLEGHPHLTRTIPFRRRLLGKAWFHPAAFAALVSLIRLLRRSRFDAVFDFQGLFRTAALARLSGCPKRLGMTAAREFAGIFYTHKVPRDPNSVHLVDYYLNMLRTAGLSVSEVEFHLPRDPAVASSVGNLLADHDVPRDRCAVLVPGSAHHDKCWPLKRFATLADWLAAEYSLSTVATGTAAESHSVEILQSLASVPVANLAGRTSLAQLIALMANAKLVVSNDTGPGHIAAALGVPVVLIFGRSNPARVAPYHANDAVAAIDPYSRPPKPDSTDPAHHIRNISLQLVQQKIHARLKAQ